MNDVLTYIISLFLEAIIVFFYCSHTLPRKTTGIFSILIFSANYFALLGLTFLNNPLINLISFFIANTICITLCFECPISSGIFNGLFISSAMAVTEFFIELAIQSFFQRYDTPDITYAHIKICIIVSKFLFFLILFIFATKKRKKAVSIINPCQIAILFLSFILIGIILYTVLNTTTDSTLAFLYEIACACIILINVFMIWLQGYIQNKQNQLDEANASLFQEKLTKSYYDLAREQDESQRILIHDIKNHLIAIQKISETDNDTAVSTYINNLLEAPALKFNYKLSTSYNLNLILSRYVSKCALLDINFVIDVARTNVDFLSPTQITSLFCNLLDNAIEAAINCKDSFIHLIIREKENSDIVTISLKNSCISIPVTNKYGSFVSSKQDSGIHGIGMKSIQKVVSAYDGEFDSFFEASDMTFHTIILLHNKRI